MTLGLTALHDPEAGLAGQVRVESPSPLRLRLLPADVVRDVRRVARRPWLKQQADGRFP
ncbi:hypothetical protein ABT214_03800 [Micromonospora purpureochromogenes]|uniref:hypothetical protein n=1 Tax=Micromonospora purpureochromogenes TaxID=47872 RepID=UPI00331A3D38